MLIKKIVGVNFGKIQDMKHQIFEITNKRIYIPVASSKVQAGFPSPATEYEDEALDINDIVVSNPAATFYVRVKGNSMIDANISEGDILEIGRASCRERVSSPV